VIYRHAIITGSCNSGDIKQVNGAQLSYWKASFDVQMKGPVQ